MNFIAIGILGVLIVIFAVRLYRLEMIYKAFDEVIIKTLSDTKHIEENRKFLTSLNNYADTTKKITDTQMIEMKKQIQGLTTLVKELNYIANKKG